MDNITMIAAIGKNKELGLKNELIWHFSEDMKFFKEQTINKPIVMGRNTFNSLPGLLPKRKHIILTTRAISVPDDVLIMRNTEDLLKYIEKYKDEVMIIGGASVYNEMLQYAKKLILTEIDATSKADTYFPRFNTDDYNIEVLSSHEENGIKYKHKVYIKK